MNVQVSIMIMKRKIWYNEALDLMYKYYDEIKNKSYILNSKFISFLDKFHKWIQANWFIIIHHLLNSVYSIILIKFIKNKINWIKRFFIPWIQTKRFRTHIMFLMSIYIHTLLNKRLRDYAYELSCIGIKNLS